MEAQEPSGKETKWQEKEDEDRSRLNNFAKEVNFAGIAKSNPIAYKSYQNNLEKLNDNLIKVDTYTNEIQRAREKLYQGQRNVENLNSLNRLNDRQHRQHIDNQMRRIREPVTDKNFAWVRDHPPKKQLSTDKLKQYISDEDFAIQNDLLDQFSASQSLDDHLSSKLKGIPRRRPNLELGNLNDSPYISNSNQQNHNSSPYNIQQNSSQFDYQYQSQSNPYPPQNPGFNAQPYSYPYPPGYVYAPIYLPAQQNETSELKSYLQRQNDLLESINRRMDTRERSRGRRGLDSRAIDSKFKDYEKETELRLQLMKQQQLIESIQNQPQQKQLQNELSNPQTLAQSLMQVVNPFHYPEIFPNYLQTPQFNPMYNPFYNGYGHPGYDPYLHGYQLPKKTKTDKKKKKFALEKTLINFCRKRNKSSSRDSSKETIESRSPSPDNKDKGQKARKSKSNRKNNDKRKTKVLDAPKEDLEKLKAEKKKNAFSKIKILLWTMVYPSLFDTDISKKVVNRRQQLQAEINEKYEPLVDNMATWMMNVTQEGITKLIDDGKKSYDFIGLDFKKLSKSDIEKRMIDCKAKVKLLLDTLISKTESFPLDSNITAFLALFCLDPVYAPDKVYSNYELMRIRFNSFGRILEINKMQSQMILGCLLIVRILVFKLIHEASKWNKKPKWTDQLLINFKVIASVIYQLTCSIWGEQLPIVNPIPSILLPQKIASLSMDPELSTESEPDNPEMIIGTLSQNQIAPIFEDKQWCDSIKQTILDWTDKLYKKLEDYRKENPIKRTFQVSKEECEGIFCSL